MIRFSFSAVVCAFSDGYALGATQRRSCSLVGADLASGPSGFPVLSNPAHIVARLVRVLPSLLGSVWQIICGANLPEVGRPLADAVWARASTQPTRRNLFPWHTLTNQLAASIGKTTA
jgi:hypothetical protein